jgi:hypothetical protein
MRKSNNRIVTFTYVYLAAGCVFVGTVLTYLLLLGSQYFGIDLMNNIWLFGIPSLLSLILNVLILELYKKLGRR